MEYQQKVGCKLISLNLYNLQVISLQKLKKLEKNDNV